MTEPHEFTPTLTTDLRGRWPNILSSMVLSIQEIAQRKLPATGTAFVLALTGCAPVVSATPEHTASAISTSTPDVSPTPSGVETVPATTPGLPTPESPSTTPSPEEPTTSPSSSPTPEKTKKAIQFSKAANKVMKEKRLDHIWELSSHTREVFVWEVIEGYEDELRAAIDNDEKIPEHIRDTWASIFYGDDAGLSGAENSNQILDFLMAERVVAFKLVNIANLDIATRFRVAMDYHSGDFDADIHPSSFGEPKLAWDLAQMKKGVKHPSWLETINSDDYQGSDTTFTCKRMTFAMGEADREDYIPGLWVAFKVKNPGKNEKGKPYKPFWLTAIMIDPSDIDKRPASSWYQMSISDINPRLAHKPSDYPDADGNSALYLRSDKGEVVCTYP